MWWYLGINILYPFYKCNNSNKFDLLSCALLLLFCLKQEYLYFCQNLSHWWWQKLFLSNLHAKVTSYSFFNFVLFYKAEKKNSFGKYWWVSSLVAIYHLKTNKQTNRLFYLNMDIGLTKVQGGAWAEANFFQILWKSRCDILVTF